MASVRIACNRRNPQKMEYLGTLPVDTEGHIARDLDLPAPVYDALEAAMARGDNEGTLYVDRDICYRWFVDR
ncbi:MAG: hypothetical protein C4297_08170 [Gemmataceae bacterium]